MFLANLALPNSYVGFIDLVGTEKQIYVFSSLSQNKDGCETHYPVPVANYGILSYHNS